MCGPTSLSLASEYLGVSSDPGELARLMNIKGTEGADYDQMILGAKTLGLLGRVVHGRSLDFLYSLKPKGGITILSWIAGSDPENDGHFSVLHKTTRTWVILNDTQAGGGLWSFRRRTFEKHWFDYYPEDGSKEPRGAIVLWNPKKRNPGLSEVLGGGE